MRTICVTFLILSLLLGQVALAAPQTIDLETMTIPELQELIADANAQINSLTPKATPEPFTTYEKGSKGNGVKAIQARLIELLYLTGTADGGYGEKTAMAVTSFQKIAGLTPTGISDSETQARLFADDAPENPEPPFDPSLYEKMNYKAIARDPDAYTGKLIYFTGKIIQVIEDDDMTQYRIASKGSYDDVVLVSYTRPEGASRILDDDKVTVYGLCLGVISYQSTMGGTITIPACFATNIELR